MALENENNVDQQNVPPEKTMLKQDVKGTVKWFNLRSGFGFINREDTNEDIFVHHSSIIRPKDLDKNLVTVIVDEEKVKFDVVKGEKGNEAANVTDESGEPVKGSQQHHRVFRRYRGRGVWRGGASSQRRFNKDDIDEQPSPRGDGYVEDYQNNYGMEYGGRGRGRRPYRGNFFYRGFPPRIRGGAMLPNGYGYGPPMMPPFRGRGGFFRGRGRFIMNGGGNMFGPVIMTEEMPMNRRMGRSRGRGGRFRGRGRRGNIGGGADQNGAQDPSSHNSDLGEEYSHAEDLT